MGPEARYTHGVTSRNEPPTDPLRAWAHRPAQVLAGQPDGALTGLHFSAKDLYGVPGWPLTAGSQAPLPDVPGSPLVAHLLELGATLVGKTELHEVALGITGDNARGGTLNPLDPTRVSGGSSGGAAASVATGEVDFALGTDTGGSIRVPAAWCGVVGFKPSKDHPAWPLTGVLPLSPTCDHAGPLARDLQMVARVHAALSGEDVRARPWAGLRVGVWDVPGWLAPAAREALDRAVTHASRLGAQVSPFAFPEVLDTYTPIVLSEGAAVHEVALREHAPGFLPFTESLLRQGAALGEAEVRAARERREALRANLIRLFETHDLLLAPAVPDVAPLLGQAELEVAEGLLPLRRTVLRLTAPWSLLGVPVVALPQRAGELSVGVQVIAPWNEDAALLGLALTYQGGLT